MHIIQNMNQIQRSYRWCDSSELNICNDIFTFSPTFYNSVTGEYLRKKLCSLGYLAWDSIALFWTSVSLVQVTYPAVLLLCFEQLFQQFRLSSLLFYCFILNNCFIIEGYLACCSIALVYFYPTWSSSALSSQL